MAIKMVRGGFSKGILAGLNYPTMPLTCESLLLSWDSGFWTKTNVCLPPPKQSLLCNEKYYFILCEWIRKSASFVIS